MLQKIEIRKSKVSGRGVFATSRIAKGEVIEICPAIPLSAAETKHAVRTSLNMYLFAWPTRSGCDRWYGSAVCLGLGSIYNHSDSPNAEWRIVPSRRQIVFSAKLDIEKGEEIFHCYNWRGEMKKILSKQKANHGTHRNGSVRKQ